MQPIETVSGADVKDTSSTEDLSGAPAGMPRLGSEFSRALSRARNLRRCFVFRFSIPGWQNFRFRFEIYVGRERQLESLAGASNSAALPDNQKIDPRNEKGWSVGTPSGHARAGRTESRRTGQLSMPLLEVQPQRYRKVLYDTPRRGRALNIEIEANAALDIFLVPESSLEAWRRGSRDYEGDGFLRRKSLKIQLGFEGRSFDRAWYLVFDNKSDAPITVSYAVYEA